MAKYELKTTLSVLEDLGINLYTNSAAVLSEMVANAWDADAESVEIDVSGSGKVRTLTVEDSGSGMDETDLNEKFLKVGYKRRESSGGGRTPKKKRSVMGRKGIGKLSCFAIAGEVEVHTVKGGSRLAFRMKLADIRKKAAAGLPYSPKVIACAMDLVAGTRIVLRELKTSINLTDKYLRRRLSRRFTIIDGAHDFEVKVNGTTVTLDDREYYSKLQYVWHYDMPGVVSQAKNADEEESRAFEVTVPNAKGKPSKYAVKGWIASVKQRSQLASEDDDNLNRLALIVRGKLAHENMLEEFAEAGVYATYLIGEIHADFLDLDNKPDIATSSRQRIVENDPRWLALKSFVQGELKHIQSSWTALRNKEGLEAALEIPAIYEWYNGLPTREQAAAKALLGRVNTLPIESTERATFFKQAVLAFEMYRVRNNLEALEKMTGDQMLTFGEVFQSIDEIEASLYHEIVKQRLAVIAKLEEHVDDDVKEKILQKHVYDHLWLLDTSWERATENALMEKSVRSMIDKVNSRLSKEIKDSRVDIRYREVSGRHVIVELKRAGRVVNTNDLLKQVDKYADGMRDILQSAGRPHEPFEIIVLVGKQLSDWSDEAAQERSRAKLKTSANARVMMYDEVILNAKARYREYLDRRQQASKIGELLNSIEEADIPKSGIVVPGTKPKKMPAKSTMQPIVRKKTA